MNFYSLLAFLDFISTRTYRSRDISIGYWGRGRAFPDQRAQLVGTGTTLPREKTKSLFFQYIG